MKVRVSVWYTLQISAIPGVSPYGMLCPAMADVQLSADDNVVSYVAELRLLPPARMTGLAFVRVAIALTRFWENLLGEPPGPSVANVSGNRQRYLEPVLRL